MPIASGHRTSNQLYPIRMHFSQINKSCLKNRRDISKRHFKTVQALSPIGFGEHWTKNWNTKGFTLQKESATYWPQCTPDCSTVPQNTELNSEYQFSLPNPSFVESSLYRVNYDIKKKFIGLWNVQYYCWIMLTLQYKQTTH